MITREEAKAIVLRRLNQNADQTDSRVVLDDNTLDLPEAWVFYWDARRAVEGDKRYHLMGNLPYIVRKADGVICRGRLTWRDFISPEAIQAAVRRLAALDQRQSEG